MYSVFHMKNNIAQVFTAVATIVFLGLLTDPFMYWMPAQMEMLILVGVTVLLCVWFGFVASEQANDEREALHRMHAGRVAYLSGIATLTIALLVQGLAHAIDPWIAATLGIMVVAKLASHFYTDRYN